jgi:hypothetical protein
VVAVAGVAMIVRSRRPLPPPKPPIVATVKVMLRSSPEGAAISVDGKLCGTSTCEAQLPPGNHRAEATLAGYQNLTKQFEVTGDKGASAEVSLLLEAPPAQMTLSTDLAEGTLSVDGAPATPIQGGETEVPRLGPGQHTLDIQSTGAKATLALEFTSAALPKVAPIKAQGINAVVVSRYGSQAMVYSNTEGIPATVDGKPAGTAGAAGLELKDLTPGPHEIQMTINGLMRKIPFESSATSGIVAWLRTERNVGTLRINTEDDVAIYLNNQKSTRTTKRGRVLLFLAPKTYTVRVEKPGLWAAEQNVEMRRGEEAQLTFKLIPAKGTLVVRNAPAGTEVWMDGAKIGIAQDGAFSSANIEPGKHTVALRKDGFKPIQGDHSFEPGKSITVEGALQSAFGSLKIEVGPPGIEGLQVRLRHEGEPEKVVSERELSLPEGTYRVTGSAPGYQDDVKNATVAVGRSVTATLVLRRLERTQTQTPQPKPTGAFTMEEWAKGGGATPSLSNWTRDGEVWVKRGGEFVVPPINPAAGKYFFTAIVRKGRRLEWVVNYRDDKNYDLFQMDDKNLVRTQFVNGKKKGDSVKSPPYSIKTKDWVSVMITVTPTSIVHSVSVQQQWQVVDQWDRPGGGLEGKFGFHVPSRDEIGVSDFRFKAN